IAEASGVRLRRRTGRAPDQVRPQRSACGGDDAATPPGRHGQALRDPASADRRRAPRLSAGVVPRPAQWARLRPCALPAQSIPDPPRDPTSGRRMNQRLPILLYHSVTDSPAPGLERFTVSPARFAEHLDFLLDDDRSVLALAEAASAIGS